MNNLAAAFKPKSLKLTPQRIAVYEMLKNTKAHPSAETIYNTIKEQYPTMSLATVYKTLKTLEEIGLVMELNVGEGNFRYDSNTQPHSHIVCNKCGKVDDIEDADLSHINEAVKKHTEYTVLSSKVYFYGICPECKTSDESSN
ncbi:transcriptional regulator PerR [Oxobacter pfennigii]|uniref:Transcriptional regulator PerR n=1 Tax=Oxobacter pfennigii TaxID=36849 RepID=A0A0P9AB43_9CLOT|nr:transcriptional repressor [Oxobacter pfennigii]KPU42273.1 transcriptional regulator PerR [Oxobacter pfennigii]